MRARGLVVGGVEHVAPFFVTLLDATTRRVVCGGTVVQPDAILTAAHCCAVERTVVHVPHVGADAAIGERLVHPGYDPLTHRHDLCVVRLLVRLPPAARPAVLFADERGDDRRVLGAGWTDNDGARPPRGVARAAVVALLPAAECAREWGRLVDPAWQVCARNATTGADSCVGDSGGPLFAGEADLHGVVSFGSGRCGDGRSAVYTRVAPYRAFVRNALCRCLVHAECAARGMARCGCVGGRCATVCGETRRCDGGALAPLDLEHVRRRERRVAAGAVATSAAELARDACAAIGRNASNPLLARLTATVGARRVTVSDWQQPVAAGDALTVSWVDAHAEGYVEGASCALTARAERAGCCASDANACECAALAAWLRAACPVSRAGA